MYTEYDADVAPDPATWLRLERDTQYSLVAAAHAGKLPDAIHSAGNELMHCNLHVIVETQIAHGGPAAAAVARLKGEGLRRHVAIHEVMRVLMGQLGGLADGGKFDQDLYAAQLAALTAGEAIGQALKTGRFGDDGAPTNRAERRAAERKRRKSGKHGAKPPKR